MLPKALSQENKKKRVKDGQRMGTEEIVFQLDQDSKVDWLIFPDFWVSSATAAASLGPWWKRKGQTNENGSKRRQPSTSFTNFSMTFMN